MRDCAALRGNDKYECRSLVTRVSTMVTIALLLAVALMCAVARQSATGFPRVDYIVPAEYQEESKIYQDLYESPYDVEYTQYDDNPNAYVDSDEAYEHSPSDTDDLRLKIKSLLQMWQEINDMNQETELPDYNEEHVFLIRQLGLREDHRIPFAENQELRSHPPDRAQHHFRADLLPETDDTNESNENPTIKITNDKENQKPLPSIYSADLPSETDDTNQSNESPTINTSNDKRAEKTNEIENENETEKKSKEEIELESLQKNEKKKSYGVSPIENGFFDIIARGPTNPDAKSLQLPRKTRQNPNLSRAKVLVTENLDKLRLGFTEKDTKSTAKPQYIHIIETTKPKTNSTFFNNTMLASAVASVSLAIVGFIFGWYTIFHVPNMSKKKAAAEMDYPTYGVTGPLLDLSGDGKLAHLAHMYHYQHQKHQILAMDSCMGRNGSVSDPDSEEENEEGDYTVYECPGFATTGNMEVKNPLFNEEPTPATPGNCEVVQPQPKE